MALYLYRIIYNHTCMQTKLIISVFTLLCFVAACQKKEPKQELICKLDCTKLNPAIKLVLFESYDTDTMFLETYTKGSGFVTPLQTEQVYNENIRTTRLSPENDYVLLIPGTKDTFKITGITIDAKTEYQKPATHRGCYGMYCFSRPYNIMVNNDSAIMSHEQYDSYIIIRK